MRRAAMALALAFLPAMAAAGETSAIQVQANVVPRCYIQSTEEIRFGALDPGQATNVSGQGAVTLACARGVDFRLVADRGLNERSGMRNMAAPGGGALPYVLRAETINGIGQGFAAPVRMTIEATVAGTDYRDLPANTYSDTIRIYLER
jgi:spore coat protein U-like protein